MVKCFLLLGTNLGDRKSNLAEARTRLGEQVGAWMRRSSVYQTAAWGKENQQDFFNQALQIKTHLSAIDLLHTCLAIEQQMGRVRLESWGSRLIDIDLLYYGQDVIQLPELQVPHPGIPHRRFTLVPLVELVPDFIHPQLAQSHRTLLAHCSDLLAVTALESCATS